MMFKQILFFLVALTAFSDASQGKFATNVTDCPPLLPRLPPSTVHDLRPDDIKVVAALGDSLLAGFAAKGVRDAAEGPTGYIEYRGVSFAMGGDPGASTLPNYFKHYQPRLTGYSLGKHEMRNCRFGLCIPNYTAETDGLNAAEGASPVSSLDSQLNYIIKRMRSMKNVNFYKDWKVITIQTGSNDICQSCFPVYSLEVSPERFARYFDALLARIQTDVPRVIVNLINISNITNGFEIGGGMNDCKRLGSTSKEEECVCAQDREKGWNRMTYTFNAYSDKLEKIYQKYQRKKSNSFAIIFQKAGLDYQSITGDFLSNFDCYHPSVIGHKFLSTISWNQMFVPHKDKPKLLTFSPDEPFYCPSESDRIITY